LENEDSPPPMYDPYQARADCNKTMIFCIVSIALLIASGAVSHPEVIAVLPGGESTSVILRFVIIIAVFLLCFLQRPRSQ
jgi:hypothetical protein